MRSRNFSAHGLLSETASDYHFVWRIQLISPRRAGFSLQLTFMTRAVAHSSATFRKPRTFVLPTM